MNEDVLKNYSNIELFVVYHIPVRWRIERDPLYWKPKVTELIALKLLWEDCGSVEDGWIVVRRIIRKKRKEKKQYRNTEKYQTCNYQLKNIARH